MQSFITKICSSLGKVFPDKAPVSLKRRTFDVLGGEVFSFQIAFFSDGDASEMEVIVDSPLQKSILVRSVELVPVDYLPESHDDDLLMDKVGLAPDMLMPLWKNRVGIVKKQWRSLWITVNVPEDCRGRRSIGIALEGVDSVSGKRIARLADVKITLNVLPLNLPSQTIDVTHWMHSDCLARIYGIKVFSAKFWNYLRKFITNAVEHGQTMLLTPVFTPPLDTQIGGERPTVQLVDVFHDGENYSFGFENLSKWFDLAQACGIRRFEISHLFTQWGALHTPKIMVKTKDGMVRRFGWETEASSKEYRNFLKAFLKALVGFFKERKLPPERIVFHCSDEPREKDFGAYMEALALMRKTLPREYRIMDAISHVAIFRQTQLDVPVVSVHAYNSFRDEKLLEKWVYYCCSPFEKYPNRFIQMPSCRNRIMGVLMYYYGIRGFLHWGFNFYYSQYSRQLIPPTGSVTNLHSFPAGDAYLVYPGENGTPLDSIRHEVFREALQDVRKLQLLESRIGRKKTLQLLESLFGGQKLSFENYPKGNALLLEIDKKIMRLLDNCDSN